MDGERTTAFRLGGEPDLVEGFLKKFAYVEEGTPRLVSIVQAETDGDIIVTPARPTSLSSFLESFSDFLLDPNRKQKDF
jgi:hypothetical protein